jgi:hypothetical protein
VVGGRFKLIPRDVHALVSPQLSDGLWENLALPINLAFIYIDSERKTAIALYPSPAGATESMLSPETWKTLLEQHPELKTIEPDVEALLVNRVGNARECFIAPIDRCFELTGLVRTHWTGLSGGEKVWREVARYFANLQLEAGSAREQEASRA